MLQGALSRSERKLNLYTRHRDKFHLSLSLGAALKRHKRKGKNLLFANVKNIYFCLLKVRQTKSLEITGDLDERSDSYRVLARNYHTKQHLSG